jgi:hypothetical protein
MSLDLVKMNVDKRQNQREKVQKDEDYVITHKIGSSGAPSTSKQFFVFIL